MGKVRRSTGLDDGIDGIWGYGIHHTSMRMTCRSPRMVTSHDITCQEGIGITTDDGQTLDVEKSADFGFDRTLDGHQLASIWEGIESGGRADHWPSCACCQTLL